MQSQANWLFEFYGTPQRRAEKVKIDAAAYPAAWILVMGVNVGDVVTAGRLDHRRRRDGAHLPGHGD